MTTSVRHPHVVVKLVGTDGNSFSILARVRGAMRRAKVPDDDVKACMTEAVAGDYDHLLRTIMRWVTVE